VFRRTDAGFPDLAFNFLPLCFLQRGHFICAGCSVGGCPVEPKPGANPEPAITAASTRKDEAEFGAWARTVAGQPCTSSESTRRAESKPGDPVLPLLLWTSSLRRADRSDMVSFCIDGSYLRNRDPVLHRSIGARYPDLAFNFVSYIDGTRFVRAGVLAVARRNRTTEWVTSATINLATVRCRIAPDNRRFSPNMFILAWQLYARN
jgi:hypothetical protein